MALSITPDKPPFSVGVRIPSWATFVRGVYPGMMAYVQVHGPWRVETAENTTQELPRISIDRRWRGDGLIVFRCTAAEHRAWTDRGIRVVNISSEPPPDGAAMNASVTPDNLVAGRVAAEHLIGRGLSRMCCWNDPSRRYSSDRTRGFAQRCKEAGYETAVLNKRVSRIPLAKRWKAIEDELLRQLPRLETPVGFFAKDDISAACVIRACRLLGLRVPDDVAVIGCNNDPAFVYTSAPGLTSVQYPAYDIGWHAAALLDRMMRDPGFEPASPIALPPTRVVERQSTMVFDYEDPLVAEVWLYLQQQPDAHVCQVRALADHLAVAEPTLRRRFKRSTGRSVKSVIDAVRLRRVQQQLEHTQQSIKHIAMACGFQAPEDLARFFRRHTGISPGRWRAGAARPAEDAPPITKPTMRDSRTDERV